MFIPVNSRLPVAMAHDLAHNGDTDRSAAVSESDEKGHLDRRQYLKLGTASAATLLIGGASVSGSIGAMSDTGERFWTEFSEGSL